MKDFFCYFDTKKRESAFMSFHEHTHSHVYVHMYKGEKKLCEHEWKKNKRMEKK